MDEIIIESLQNIAQCFANNELAYLALTVKIELPFRDRWACSLYQGQRRFIIAREWRRIDLAILENQEPKALIQLKAMYTFDAVNGNAQGFLENLAMDIENAGAMRGNPAIYGVLLATHPQPETEIPVDYEGVIKYRRGINNALATHNHNNDQITQQAQNRIYEMSPEILGGGNLICASEVNGGVAFGIPTKVLYWVWRKEV